ncbi:hypothetical protein [Xanthobacter versatilis]|uniref:hypothetical protein n=1 Tax=Xanthobacter autotrophicus (strain ATCC BAA-1158 / Py2) TaxID=78245 RepID=UPI0037287ABA
MSTARHLPAAVLHESDASAAEAARVVPRGAKLYTVGTVVLGYTKAPAKGRCGLRHLRLAELKRLILARHGRGGADTDDAGLYLAFAAHHLLDAPAIREFARRFTPGAPAVEIEEAVDAALSGPRRYTADEAASALAVKNEERERLGLRSIGAVDCDADARKAERRRKDAEAKRAQRAAAPRRPTSDAVKPWVAEGVSRATWFRRQKAKREAVAASETGNVGNRYSDCTADAGSLTPRPAPPQRLQTEQPDAPAHDGARAFLAALRRPCAVIRVPPSPLQAFLQAVKRNLSELSHAPIHRRTCRYIGEGASPRHSGVSGGWPQHSP